MNREGAKRLKQSPRSSSFRKLASPFGFAMTGLFHFLLWGVIAAETKEGASRLFSDFQCSRAWKGIGVEAQQKYERASERLGTTDAEKKEYLARRHRVHFLLDEAERASEELGVIKDFIQFIEAGSWGTERYDPGQRAQTVSDLIDLFNESILQEMPFPSRALTWLRGEKIRLPKKPAETAQSLKERAELLAARSSLTHWRAQGSIQFLRSPLNVSVQELSSAQKKRALEAGKNGVDWPQYSFNAPAVLTRVRESPRVADWIKNELEREQEFMGTLGITAGQNPALMHFLAKIANYYAIPLN